jgi:hypothetical protein
MTDNRARITETLLERTAAPLTAGDPNEFADCAEIRQPLTAIIPWRRLKTNFLLFGKVYASVTSNPYFAHPLPDLSFVMIADNRMRREFLCGVECRMD